MTPAADPSVRPATEADREWVRRTIEDRWGLPVVSVSGAYDPSTFPALVAEGPEGPVGLLTYRLDNAECEVVTLDAFVPRRGVGTALLREARRLAGHRRLWLITTDENRRAIAFYEAVGLHVVRRHRDFVSTVAALKVLPADARGFRDALEFEYGPDAQP